MIIITGSYFPDICGVGDFVTKLVKNSNFKYIKVTNFLEFFNMAKSTYSNNKILLEYPTQGYGWSLLPHFFTFFRWLMFKPIVVHIHELKYQSLKNRLASYIFLFFSSKLIVSNKEEFLFLHRYFQNKTSIIPIFSNVEVHSRIKIMKNIDLIYFGQIRPNKGIEHFIYKSEQLTDLNIKIIGAVPDFCKDYADNLIKSTSIDFILNHSLKEVSLYLSKARCAYLPFPDGASLRRGSLLACLEHGVKVLSNRGASSNDLEDYIYFDDECDFIEFLNSENKKDVFRICSVKEICKKIENVVC